MFKSLAFVPMNLLETAFQYLIFSKHLFPQSDKLDSFLDYFHATWFDRFKPNHWNYYETIDPRSNNHLEGFNYKLNKFIDFIHPNIYSLVNTFKGLEL